MLTTVIQVQQGIYEKAYDSLVTQYQNFWMHPDCTPPPKYEIMAPATPEERRPEFRRLRSNSVPIAVSLMDCTAEEAGLLFSAAEKASARRRKAQSFNDTMITPLAEEPTPESIDGPLYEDIEDADEYSHVDTLSSPPSQQEPTTPSLLGSEDSTPMVSPGIKGYNDDMVKFVKQRLQDMAHTYCSPPPAARQQTKNVEQEPIYITSPQRPELRSHFSNWSIASPEEDEPNIADLASSPAATEDSLDDDVDGDDTGMLQAHVVQYRQRSDMEKAAPRCYFSWPARAKSKTDPRPITFDTPITAELRTADIGRSSTPLIDLDASQPEVGRFSKDAGFFDFGFGNDRRLTPSPSPAGPLGPLPQYAGQPFPSPRPIAC